MKKKIPYLYNRIHERMIQKFPSLVVDFKVLKMWLGGSPLYINRQEARILIDEMQFFGLLNKKRCGRQGGYIYIKKV